MSNKSVALPQVGGEGGGPEEGGGGPGAGRVEGRAGLWHGGGLVRKQAWAGMLGWQGGVTALGTEHRDNTAEGPCPVCKLLRGLLAAHERSAFRALLTGLPAPRLQGL